MTLGFRVAVGIGRGVGPKSSNFVGAPSLALCAPNCQTQSSRSIVTKENLRLPPFYPEPWPYRERGYDYEKHCLLDHTESHFHKNSKLIVVEGNMSAQKSQTAREIADALGFYYYPEFKMDDILIDRYGNDLRNFYHHFPESWKVPDMPAFYKHPYADQAALMQWRFFSGRFDQYFNALAHIFNTGQGVVLERSIFSDCVFTNAMRAKDYIGPEFFRLYYYVRKACIKNAHFYPHLVVYLDAPVNKCLENIRKRGNPAEIEVADEKYLSVIAESYKDVLRELKRYSRVLTYDWTEPGHTDNIIEDIEDLEMDFAEWHSTDVFDQWNRLVDFFIYNGWRHYVTDGKIRAYYDTFHPPIEAVIECGELYQHAMDSDHMDGVMKHVVLKSLKGHGFIRERGDPIKGITNLARVEGQMAERWYEYYWRERWYAELFTPNAYFDPKQEGFDPLYVHHH